MIAMVVRDFMLVDCRLEQGHVIWRTYLADMEGNWIPLFL